MAGRFRRAVVTGGAGFLGSHVCDSLLGRGVEVVCLDNFLTGTPANVAHLLGDPGFGWSAATSPTSCTSPGPSTWSATSPRRPHPRTICACRSTP